ncbi:MAG: GGDEF domain-containing protein [Synergistaceae bacterium]|nr:GGDEF domain-containing protein [Synergistaceae bacterium]
MKNNQLSFTGLALALANDYSRIFVINEDDSYVEYTPAASKLGKELVQASEGDDFYKDAVKNCREQVWHEDQEYFLNAFRKDAVVKALENGKSFYLTYRLNINGEPKYFFLKTIRSGNSNIIIGVQDIDEQRRRELDAEAEGRIYGEIAKSLANQYEVIYYIDVKTGKYSEYSSSDNYAEFGLHRGGENFFERLKIDIKRILHPDDQMRILRALEKDELLTKIRNEGSLSMIYRHVLNGNVQYMNLFAYLQKKDTEHLILGVRNIDEQQKQEDAITTYSQIAGALAQQYEVIYHVNTITNEYLEYTADRKYTKLKVFTKGKDFFADSQKNMKTDIYPEDLPMMSIAMQKENLLKSLSDYGKTILNYRLMLDGRPQFAMLYAVRPKENSNHIIVAVANVDAAKQMELAYHDAINMANKDALTNVKNKRAYAAVEAELDRQISEGSEMPQFAIVVCDLNGLKQINDTLGHKAGDEFIRRACAIICNIFKRSPVFRIGGDEFAILLNGSDFDKSQELMENLIKELEKNRINGIKPLAVGLSEFNPLTDIRVQDVFERADKLMYADKLICKKIHNS